jgi:hypothetical protein
MVDMTGFIEKVEEERSKLEIKSKRIKLSKLIRNKKE